MAAQYAPKKGALWLPCIDEIATIDPPQEEERRDVLAHGRLELVDGELQDRCGTRGATDDATGHVDASGGFGGHLDERLDLIIIQRVAHHVADRAARVAGERRESRRVICQFALGASGDHDVCAVADQELGRGASDASGAAGDDSRHAREWSATFAHSCPPASGIINA